MLCLTKLLRIYDLDGSSGYQACVQFNAIHHSSINFRPLTTGLIEILDTRGRTFGPESLENVIVEKPIISGVVGIPLTPVDDNVAHVSRSQGKQ